MYVVIIRFIIIDIIKLYIPIFNSDSINIDIIFIIDETIVIFIISFVFPIAFIAVASGNCI